MKTKPFRILAIHRRKEKAATWRGFGFWGFIDQLGHVLHLPKKFQDPICNKFDQSLIER